MYVEEFTFLVENTTTAMATMTIMTAMSIMTIMTAMMTMPA
jgi:hypothetical protein